jgi:hypothetical protein
LEKARRQEGLAVSEKTIGERVETLEKDMDSLRELPAKVDDLGKKVSAVDSRLTTVESQIVLLRTEMNDGFSAIRGEMVTKTELGNEMSAMKTELRGEMGAMKKELQEDIAGLGRDMAEYSLQTQRHVTMIFEEHLGRRSVTAEGNPPVDPPPTT